MHKILVRGIERWVGRTDAVYKAHILDSDSTNTIVHTGQSATRVRILVVDGVANPVIVVLVLTVARNIRDISTGRLLLIQ